MPIHSPLRMPQRPNPILEPAKARRTGLRRRALPLAVLGLLAFPSAARSQILAHPGWTRSGFAAEPWFQRAVFYQVRGASPDFKALALRLDAMQSTGIDAIIVTPPALPSLAGVSAEQAIAAQSALDAFDSFTRQATARGIRILVALSVAHADADLAGRTRFWLTRGVSGLRIEFPPEVSAEGRAAIAASVRTIAASIAGQRVVLVDEDETVPAGDASRRSRPASGRRAARDSPAAPELLVTELSGPLTAAALRPQMAQALAARDVLLDTRPAGHAPDSAALAKVLATLALVSNDAALADPAQPLVLPATQPTQEAEDDTVKPAPAPIPRQPPSGVYLPYVPYVPPPRPQKKTALPPPPADPLTAWYAQLDQLHHTNQALRSGSKTMLDLDTDNVLAWVARPSAPTPQNPPVVVLCNLSAQPVTVSIAEAIKRISLHGFFLRALLRSDDAMGAEDLEGVKLAPHGVFIGELRR